MKSPCPTNPSPACFWFLLSAALLLWTPAACVNLTALCWLCCACAPPSQDTIDAALLQQHQADIDCVDEAAKWSVLHYAVAGHKEAMVKQLLDAGASPDTAAPGGVRPLHLACSGPLTTASTRSKICLAHFYDQQQLWKKAGRSSSAIVKLLLAAGADPASRTASGATGLHIAANSGSADVIGDLLESSEDLDPDDDGAYNCEC